MELEVVCLRGTRIVMRRACLCEVRWGNGLRCGTRAVVRRCCGRICWLRWEATDLCPSLREIHVVTLFLRASVPTRRDVVPGCFESDRTGFESDMTERGSFDTSPTYQNRRSDVLVESARKTIRSGTALHSEPGGNTDSRGVDGEKTAAARNATRKKICKKYKLLRDSSYNS